MDLVQLPHESITEKARKVGKMSSTATDLKDTMEELNKKSVPMNINTGSKMPPLIVPRYEELIGETPLVDISSLATPKVSGVRVLAKCEFLNPGFSIKDRIARNILDDALDRGKVAPGGTVVVASSGNTGAAVAMMAAMRGYRAVVTTTPKCSREKMDAIRAYGAELQVAPSGVPESHPRSYMNMAKTLAAENADWFDVDQYDNESNADAHFRTLGPEIWAQTQGRVTHFVAGGSTGGTISGVSRFLKSMNPGVKCVLADPRGSIFANYVRERKVDGSPGKFLVEGVGKGTIPGCLDPEVIDEVIEVNDADAFRTCRELARKEGILAGGSSGLNTFAAIKMANEAEEPVVIVTVLCDLGVKYLSKVYNEDWLRENGLDVDVSGAESGGSGSSTPPEK